MPIGSVVLIEATPGRPPPNTPFPDVLGQPGTAAVANLRADAWIITPEEVLAPEIPYRLPNGEWLKPGHIWRTDPPAGTRSEDGQIRVFIQPGDAPPPPTTTTTVTTTTAAP